MYSNSNAFMGGGNSQRPGGQQFGGGQFNSPMGSNLGPGGQQQQQQPSPFAPQPTGFGQQPLQQQYTGYPMQPQQTGMPQSSQPLQQQYTGFPGQSQPQQSFQTGAAPPMPSIPQQYQQQFQQQQQPQSLQNQPAAFSPSPNQSSGPTQPPAPMKPQPTGFNEMAASFHTGGASKPRETRSAKTNKIPNIRLSFITAQDQTKFENLFTTSVGEKSTTMSGDKARDLLLRSRLDGDTLSHIW